MGQVFATAVQTTLTRHVMVAGDAAARLDAMRAGVDADLATFGADIVHCYAMERVRARLAGDWCGFRHADDKLTYLRCIAG